MYCYITYKTTEVFYTPPKYARLIVLHGTLYSNNRFVIDTLCFLIFCCSFWLFVKEFLWHIMFCSYRVFYHHSLTMMGKRRKKH